MKLIPIFLLIAMLAVPANALYRAAYPLENIGKERIFESRLRESGELLGSGRMKVYRQRYAGQEFVIIETNGRGRTPKGESVTTNRTAYYTIKDGLLTVHSQNSETSKEGNPFLVSRADFDWKKGEASFEFTNFEKAQEEKKTVKLSPDTVLVQDLTIYTQNMLIKGEKERTVRAIVPTGTSFNMKIRAIDEPEEINVQGKKRACYRVEMKPDLGLISLLIPNVNYWFSADKPYDFLRYEGLQSGPGSPDIIQERVK